MKNHETIKGYFNAITFDDQIYEFIVDGEGNIYCDAIIKDRAIKKLIMKPNFEAILVNGGWVSCDCLARMNGGRKSLIKDYNISPQLAEKLVLNHSIMYSVDMAYLYGLDYRYAYDREDQTRAFKHVKNPAKRLVKQKQGIFN